MPELYPALALIELDSFAIGVLTADALVKRSPIKMLKAGTVSGGRYLLLFGGSVAAVEEAFQEGMVKGGTAIRDKVILPDIHPQVNAAVLGKRLPCDGESLAIIELRSVASTILVADKAVKGAEVRLVGMRLADQIGGRGFAIFTGKLEDVETTIRIGHEYVPDERVWISECVIPRLSSEIADQLNNTTRWSSAPVQLFEEGE